MNLNLISSKYQTKSWRNQQSWYINGKHNECEKYQFNCLESKLSCKINKTNDSIQNLDINIPGYEARKKMLENIISSCQFVINCFSSEIKLTEDTCPICRCEFDDPVVTSCGHNFCYDCINEVLNLSSFKKECPICRAQISNSEIFKLEDKIEDNEQIDELIYKYGTKIAKLIKLCRQILINKNSKTVSCALRTKGVFVKIRIPSLTFRVQEDTGFGNFSISTKHIRQLPAIDNFL